MRTSHLGCCAGVALLAACASAATSTPDADARRAIPADFAVEYRVDAPTSHHVVPLPRDRAWQLLPDAFRYLGFPATPASNSQHIMITPYLKVEGRLYPDELTSAYLDCGTVAGGGFRADIYQVTFVIVTQLQVVDSTNTAVKTTLDGKARPKAIESASVTCNGTGKLEKQIVEFLQAKAKGFELASAQTDPALALLAHLVENRHPLSGEIACVGVTARAATYGIDAVRQVLRATAAQVVPAGECALAGATGPMRHRETGRPAVLFEVTLEEAQPAQARLRGSWSAASLHGESCQYLGRLAQGRWVFEARDCIAS